ncbi:SH3 domain-containing protein [Myxococcaceae bacterium GXIMD 01537]
MRSTLLLLAAVLTLGTAGAARAVPRGGTLYVKVKNTRLMSNSTTNGQVLRVLQPGQTVVWLGADPKNRQWHQVEVDGGKGVVFQSNLATRPPELELVASAGGPARDADTFANSGAAVKLLSDGAIRYGDAKGGDVKDAVAQLQRLQDVAATIRAEDCAAHASKARLFPVVAPSSGGSQGVAGGGTP